MWQKEVKRGSQKGRFSLTYWSDAGRGAWDTLCVRCLRWSKPARLRPPAPPGARPAKSLPVNVAYDFPLFFSSYARTEVSLCQSWGTTEPDPWSLLYHACPAFTRFLCLPTVCPLVCPTICTAVCPTVPWLRGTALIERAGKCMKLPGMKWPYNFPCGYKAGCVIQ